MITTSWCRMIFVRDMLVTGWIRCSGSLTTNPANDLF